jgi:hypothetical protein
MNMSKKVQVYAALALAAVAGVALADSDAAFIQKKIETWFASATPVGQGIFLTDRNKCLYSVVETVQGLKLITIKTEKGSQLCQD